MCLGQRPERRGTRARLIKEDLEMNLPQEMRIGQELSREEGEGRTDGGLLS